MPKLEGFTHPVNIITSFLSNHLQKLSGYLSLDCSGGPTDWTLPSVDPRRQHSPPTGPSKFSSSAFTPVPGPPLYNMNMTNGSGDNLRAWINHFGLLFCWAFLPPSLSPCLISTSLLREMNFYCTPPLAQRHSGGKGIFISDIHTQAIAGLDYDYDDGENHYAQNTDDDDTSYLKWM